MDMLESYKYQKIHDLAAEDRPREKLVAQGAALLSNAELLAILLGSGVQNMTSIDLAKYVLKGQDQSLHKLGKLSIQELVRYRGIGYAKAAIIASAIELSRRLQVPSKAEKKPIKSSRAAYELIRHHFINKLTEECWVMLLNHDSRLLKNHQISKGGLTRTTVDPRVVFKVALDHHATRIVLVHNHPSGNLNPSRADVEVTDRLLKGSKYLGIELFDHLIVTQNTYYSFRADGLI